MSKREYLRHRLRTLESHERSLVQTTMILSANKREASALASISTAAWIQLSQTKLQNHPDLLTQPKMPPCSQKPISPNHHARKLLFESILTFKLLNQLDILALCVLGFGALLNGVLPCVILVFTLGQDCRSAMI